MNWYPTIEMETLLKKGKHIAKIDGEAILLLSDTKRNVYAVQAKCPHQGYLLSEGDLKGDCTLVCHYHNWKFDLKTGKPLFGNDSLKTYATKIQDGLVYIDTTPIAREEMLAKILEGLRKGYDEADYGQIARSLSRLHKEGFDPKLALREAIVWSHDFLHYGLVGIDHFE